MAQSIEHWKNIESEALASNFVRTGDTEIVAAVSKIVLCFLSAEYDNEMIANGKAKIF